MDKLALIKDLHSDPEFRELVDHPLHNLVDLPVRLVHLEPGKYLSSAKIWVEYVEQAWWESLSAFNISALINEINITYKYLILFNELVNILSNKYSISTVSYHLISEYIMVCFSVKISGEPTFIKITRNLVNNIELSGDDEVEVEYRRDYKLIEETYSLSELGNKIIEMLNKIGKP